jgi:hypothetical protein
MLEACGARLGAIIRPEAFSVFHNRKPRYQRQGGPVQTESPA